MKMQAIRLTEARHAKIPQTFRSAGFVVLSQDVSRQAEQWPKQQIGGFAAAGRGPISTCHYKATSEHEH